MADCFHSWSSASKCKKCGAVWSRTNMTNNNDHTEAEVRERIAAEIEALPLALYGDRVTLTPARIRQDAARIARGQDA